MFIDAHKQNTFHFGIHRTLFCYCFSLSQAYIEKFKFSSVVAQDLLDFFLGFFPELKESCVAQREGEWKRTRRLGHFKQEGT